MNISAQTCSSSRYTHWLLTRQIISGCQVNLTTTNNMIRKVVRHSTMKNINCIIHNKHLARVCSLNFHKKCELDIKIILKNGGMARVKFGLTEKEK